MSEYNTTVYREQGGDKLVASSGGTVEIQSGGTLDCQAGSTVNLPDDTVTVAKTLVFVSTETTGTGSAQNVAHGLGVVPSIVLVAVTEHPGTPDTGAFDVAEGTHTNTNVVLTVTANVKFKVLAWA